MGVPETASSIGGPPGENRAATWQLLRTRWRTASLASGWAYPGDWALREVDEVCSAVLAGYAKRSEMVDVLTKFGRARAETGAELGETLRDLDALHHVAYVSSAASPADIDQDETPGWMLRAAALGWAETALVNLGDVQIIDALTGLATAAYLRTRLGEVYQSGSWNDYVLVVVSVDASGLDHWSRAMAMILVAEVLREVFSTGQTRALLGSSVATVLTAHDARLASKRAETRWALARRLAADPALGALNSPEIWCEPLPATYSAAMSLLTRLGHNGR